MKVRGYSSAASDGGRGAHGNGKGGRQGGRESWREGGGDLWEGEQNDSGKCLGGSVGSEEQCCQQGLACVQGQRGAAELQQGSEPPTMVSLVAAGALSSEPPTMVSLVAAGALSSEPPTMVSLVTAGVR